MDEKYNKAYVIAKYVESLGLSIGDMLKNKASSNYYFNSESDNKNRIELIDNIHNKAIEAIEKL